MVRTRLVLGLIALAGIAALLALLLRPAEAPAPTGVVVVNAAPVPEAEPIPPPEASPTPREEPQANVVLIPDAPARSADGQAVTRCTDPEC